MTTVGQPGPRQPLRILLALEAAGGGAGRHVLDLAGGLLAGGHVVHLAYSPLRIEPPFAAGLGRLPRLVRHEVAMRRAPGPHDIASIRQLRRLLRTQGPFDVAHGHSSKAGALLRLAAIGTGVPVIYTPHAFITLDPTLRGPMRLLYGAAERILAGLGARIVCVSEEERAHARALGIPASRLAVVPNGLPPLPPADRAAERRALGLGPQDTCIGFVGRMSGQKAVERLVTAFAAIASEQPRARLVLVGDGPDLPQAQAEVGRLGLAARVVFPGHGDGPTLMSAFDIFALPSRYEGLPYVLLEAAARGLPIVTMDVGGAATVVGQGENGYIVPQADAATGLAARLGELLADASLRGRMSARSRERAASMSVERMTGQVLGIYAEAMAKCAGARPQ